MTAADSRYRGLRGILGAFGTPAAGTMLFLGFGSGLHIDCQGSNRGAMNLIAAKKAKRPTPENWPNCLIMKPGARSGNRTRTPFGSGF